MDIAKAKRRENIAEYILYLWQLEDLLLRYRPTMLFVEHDRTFTDKVATRCIEL